MHELLLNMQQVSFQREDTIILQNIELQMAAGEIVTVIGPNGAGKSTLVKLALGLLQPSSGSIQRPKSLRIGYMPQRLQLDPSLPINVQRFLALTGANTSAIHRALEEVGIPNLLTHPLAQVSGGELQRVLLARALLREPQLLVLDEPAQGVDITGQNELYALISTLRNRHGCGVLMVSHDLHLVMAQTDTVICLNRHVCCHGHPEQVSNDPAYRQLFGQQPTDALALYQHDHDHQHDLHGDVVDGQEGCKHG